MHKKALWIWPSLFVMLLFFAILFQTKKVGFESGHYGWVSSHCLAIAAKATSENNWVGYALKEYTASGEHQYKYFDRYPVFFSVFLHQVLDFFPQDLGKQVYAARVVMNVIFILTILFFFLSLNLLLQDVSLSLAAVLLAFSGGLFMFYKDMIHYDQPALLGISIMLYFITRFELKKPHRWLYFVAPVCVCLGRGYAGLSLLGLWFIISAILLFRNQSFSLASVGKMINLHPLKVFVLSVGVLASALSFNIATEMNVRNVSYKETSIVISANKRLGLDASFDKDYKDWLSPLNVLKLSAERIYTNLFPEVLASKIDTTVSKLKTIMHSTFSSLILLRLVVLCFLLPILYFGSLRLFNYRKPSERLIIGLFALPGLWLILIKRLFVFHDYTTMYHAGFHVLFMCILLLGIKDNLRKWALPICFLIFVSSLYTVGNKHNDNLEVFNRVTTDFNEVQRKLNETNQEVYIDGGRTNFIPGAPFALGFYLPQQWLSARPQARFALTYNPIFGNENLTPNNKYVFLFRQ